MKTFEIKRKQKPPLEFALSVERKEIKDSGEEVFVPETLEFTALGTPPAGYWGEFLDVARLGGALPGPVIRFIQGVLVPEDVSRFRQLVYDKDAQVEGAELAEIADWLIEEYADRPTKRPGSSSSGPSTTGASSEGSSQSEA